MREIRSHRAPEYARPPRSSRQITRLRAGLAASITALALVAGAFFMFGGTPAAPPASQQVAEDLPLLTTPEEVFAWCAAHNTAAFRARLNADGKTVIRGCANIGQVLASMTPTPTPGPTSSPTTSPTPSPTTPPTPSPTASPTPSPTASPTPTTSPTAGPQNNCMPQPSRCGYPDTTNTGVRFVGPLVLVNGNVTLSTAGMIYENRDVRGCITVKAKNVTIRNVKVSCSGWYAIAINTGSGNPWAAPDANTLIEDVEINHLGQFDGKGVAFDGFTLRRVYYHNGADCAHTGYNTVIEDSYCILGPDGATNRDWCHMRVSDGHGGTTEPHWDGYQSDGGDHQVYRHNTIRNPCQQTSAILISTNTLPIGNVTIERNLVAGGGWTIYCGTSEGGFPFGSNVFRDNRIARSFYTWPPGPDHTDGDVGGYYGPMTSCRASNIAAAGNVWDETNTLIPLE